MPNNNILMLVLGVTVCGLILGSSGSSSTAGTATTEMQKAILEKLNLLSSKPQPDLSTLTASKEFLAQLDAKLDAIASQPVAKPAASSRAATGPNRCPVLKSDKLTIRESELKALDHTLWDRYLPYCCMDDRDMEDDFYRKFFKASAGKEHYALLGWAAKYYGDRGGGVLVEVGSREGASSMALGSDPRNSVYSFDIMSTADHVSRVMKRRGMGPANPTRADVQAAMPNVHYIVSNVTDESKPMTITYRNLILSSSMILLDTAHLPETYPFEYTFIEFLDKYEYAGYVLLDDIHLNGEMERFWAFLVKKYGPDRAVDITKVGHGSGTGLLDFCGFTTYIEDL